LTQTSYLTLSIEHTRKKEESITLRASRIEWNIIYLCIQFRCE